MIAGVIPIVAAPAIGLLVSAGLAVVGTCGLQNSAAVHIRKWINEWSKDPRLGAW